MIQVGTRCPQRLTLMRLAASGFPRAVTAIIIRLRPSASSSEKPIHLFELKGGTIAAVIPQRVGRQPVCSGAPEAHRAKQSPPLMPTQPKNPEQATCNSRRFGNDRALHPDIIDNVLDIRAIRLSSG